MCLIQGTFQPRGSFPPKRGLSASFHERKNPWPQAGLDALNEPGRATGGRGLGLATVRHVAQTPHGVVQVDSREGEGATFMLRLPLHGRPEA